VTTYWLNGESDGKDGEDETRSLLPTPAEAYNIPSQPLTTRSVSQLLINYKSSTAGGFPHVNSNPSLRGLSQSQRNIGEHPLSSSAEMDREPLSSPSRRPLSVREDMLTYDLSSSAKESKDIPNSVVVHSGTTNSIHLTSSRHPDPAGSINSNLLDSNSNNKGPLSTESS